MLIGKGAKDVVLKEEEVFNLCDQAFSQKDLDGKKLLVIIPDHSRTAPIDMMFRLVYQLLADRVQLLDFLIALGTHPPMSDEMINKRVGITQEDRVTKYQKARFFNHSWNDPNQLRLAGTITEKEVEEISEGLMREEVEVTVNKMIYNYDLLLIIGPTFPHEVVGFSGGNKYLFPGIAGQKIIDMFHWLGALITIYIGTPEEAWDAAADLSNQLHIIYKEKPFHTVLSRAPEMYDDLWTGGKCMYKLEPVVADGGELIIYAPHIKEISVTHGKIIEKIGYHVRDYFLKQMDKFKDIPGGVMAHSTHVRGIGTYENGVEKPRIKVTLATQIPEEVCQKINLGYRDPRTINIADFENREEEGILYVPKAGEMLYRLKDDPFCK